MRTNLSDRHKSSNESPYNTWCPDPSLPLPISASFARRISEGAPPQCNANFQTNYTFFVRSQEVVYGESGRGRSAEMSYTNRSSVRTLAGHQETPMVRFKAQAPTDEPIHLLVNGKPTRNICKLSLLSSRVMFLNNDVNP